MKPARVLLAAVAAVSLALADGPPGTAHRAQQTPPIKLGVSGANTNDKNAQYCCTGTLGSSIFRTVNGVKTQYILSNNHVLARTNLAPIGEGIIHRGYVDTVPVCSSTGTITVANLSQFVAINFTGGTNTVDAAIAQVVPGMVDSSGYIMDIGPVSSATVTPALNMAVRKSGRTTGLTSGSISAVNVTVNVTYNTSCGIGSQVATFANQIAIGPSGFSGAGDSGA